MKTTIKAMSRFFQLLFLLCTATLLTACEDENIQPIDDPAMTDEQAAEIVEAALITDAEGLTADLADASDIAGATAARDLVPCGTPQDSSFSVNYTGDRGSVDYSGNVSWTPLCGQGGLVRSINFSRTSAGTYTTPRLNSDDSANGDWTIDNITGGTAYVINGTYVRNGQQTVTTRRRTSDFTTALDFEVEALNINKGTRRIESGIASFSLTGTGSNGQNVDLDGQVIFQGEGAALIIINGNQFELSL